MSIKTRSSASISEPRGNDIMESPRTSIEGDKEKSKEDIKSITATPIERTTTQQLSTLHSIITGRSTTSTRDPGPPPDGGFNAWFTALMALFVIFNSWGYIQTFGVFQTYYVSALHESPSTISWIGSVQIFLLFFLGPLTGRATDAGYFRPVFVLGLVLQLLGVFMTSLSTKYWQVFLAQGVCQGIGNGMQFVPTMSLLSTYFHKYRSFAIGISATGATIGGMVMPAMVQQLLPKIGFAWTVRCLGLLMAILGVSAAIVLKTRIPPRKAGPLVEWSAFTEPPFLLFCTGMFLNFWGVYFPFYYVGSYGRNLLGLSYTDSITLLLIMNAVGVPGRLLPNIIADRCIGPINMITLSSLASAIVTFTWVAVASPTGLRIFSVFFGITAAGIQSLFPACLASLTPDLQKRGVRMGMGFAVAGVASLTGTPLGGALVQVDKGGYLYAQMWAGASLIAAAGFLGASRWASVGGDLRARY